MIERQPEAVSQDDRVVTTFKLNVKGTTNLEIAFLGDIVAEPGSDTTGQSLFHVQLKYYIIHNSR